MRNVKLQMLVEMAVAVALALVLNKLTLFHMPQGGSVNLEMLPILFVALRWGVWAGMLAGVVDGLLQLIFGGYVFHPVQVILDYPLAFALLGLAGLFMTNLEEKNGAVKIICGSILAVLGRFLSHVVSGAIFFGEYAPEGQNVWVYSSIYNGSYLIPSLLVSIVVLLLLKDRLAGFTKTRVSA